MASGLHIAIIYVITLHCSNRREQTHDPDVDRPYVQADQETSYQCYGLHVKRYACLIFNTLHVTVGYKDLRESPNSKHALKQLKSVNNKKVVVSWYLVRGTWVIFKIMMQFLLIKKGIYMCCVFICVCVCLCVCVCVFVYVCSCVYRHRSWAQIHTWVRINAGVFHPKL